MIPHTNQKHRSEGREDGRARDKEEEEEEEGENERAPRLSLDLAPAPRHGNEPPPPLPLAQDDKRRPVEQEKKKKKERKKDPNTSRGGEAEKTSRSPEGVNPHDMFTPYTIFHPVPLQGPASCDPEQDKRLKRRMDGSSGCEATVSVTDEVEEWKEGNVFAWGAAALPWVGGTRGSM
ncbi:unnamed protein product [Pleuronectes platessa]|uniref:Uncharacterized protein n=1 Tax=Pleuronectes platessa TaxID=8262 RepID=A0A9N7Z2D5_PLEPL|nr:unnamed protein product [Pleuronectes platessa]